MKMFKNLTSDFFRTKKLVNREIGITQLRFTFQSIIYGKLLESGNF